LFNIFQQNIAPWSAFHSQDYGYTQLFVHNNSHIEFKQISVDKAGEVIDNFFVIKDSHGVYEKSHEID
jgi:hypothetical protein